MKLMPAEGSRRWWRLWYSGAIDRKPVFLRRLAVELALRKEKAPYYYSESIAEVLCGGPVHGYSRGFIDLLAVVKQALRLRESEYERIGRDLLGRSPQEAEDWWRQWGIQQQRNAIGMRESS
jgi:hypothetical protein